MLTKPGTANTSADDVIKNLHEKLQSSRNNGKLLRGEKDGKLKVVTSSGLLNMDDKKVQKKMDDRCGRELQRIKNGGKTDMEFVKEMVEEMKK